MLTYVNASQDVEPPAYLLAGDEDGYLSVLPARTDSKFFAIDVWKSSWRQQVTGARWFLEVATLRISPSTIDTGYDRGAIGFALQGCWLEELYARPTQKLF